LCLNSRRKRRIPSSLFIRSMSADQFFSAEQRRRLEELMAQMRAAPARNSPLSADEQVELERLVDSEVQATTVRAKALIRKFGR
jgi:hypothetical protein